MSRSLFMVMVFALVIFDDRLYYFCFALQTRNFESSPTLSEPQTDTCGRIDSPSCRPSLLQQELHRQETDEEVLPLILDIFLSADFSFVEIVKYRDSLALMSRNSTCWNCPLECLFDDGTTSTTSNNVVSPNFAVDPIGVFISCPLPPRFRCQPNVGLHLRYAHLDISHRPVTSIRFTACPGFFAGSVVSSTPQSASLSTKTLPFNSPSEIFLASIVILSPVSAIRLPEFIEYHRKLGVERFFVAQLTPAHFNDAEESRRGTERLIEPYLAEGIVAFIEYRDRRLEEYAYEHAIMPNQPPTLVALFARTRSRVKWMMFLDVDEFAVSVIPSDTLAAALQSLDGAIGIHSFGRQSICTRGFNSTYPNLNAIRNAPEDPLERCPPGREISTVTLVTMGIGFCDKDPSPSSYLGGDCLKFHYHSKDMFFGAQFLRTKAITRVAEFGRSLSPWIHSNFYKSNIPRQLIADPFSSFVQAHMRYTSLRRVQPKEIDDTTMKENLAYLGTYLSEAGSRATNNALRRLQMDEQFFSRLVALERSCMGEHHFAGYLKPDCSPNVLLFN